MNIWKKGEVKPANWPQWLKDADIEWCKVDIVDVIDDTVMWYDGVWNRGEWHEGIWYGGVWRSGEWRSGRWYGGEWREGNWRSGEWRDGEWHGGFWLSGIWRGGIWYSGVWRGGSRYGGSWYGGEWRDGCWRGGEWYGGEWYGGIWHGGDRVSCDVNQSLVGWSGHGECGRTLRAWDCPDRKTTMYSCGCFYGSREELTDFIYNGEERYRESRLRTLAYVDELLENGRTPAHL